MLGQPINYDLILQLAVDQQLNGCNTEFRVNWKEENNMVSVEDVIDVSKQIDVME